MNEKLRSLQFIHLGISGGATLLYLLLGNITFDTLIIRHVDTSEIIYIAIPVLAIILSNILFKSQLKQTKPILSIEENMSTYQTASLIRWAILEGAAFMIFFIKPEFISFGILVIAYLISLRPTINRIESDLQSV
ncbi:MAG: MFS transporter [Flavobacterium sp.]